MFLSVKNYSLSAFHFLNALSLWARCCTQVYNSQDVYKGKDSYGIGDDVDSCMIVVYSGERETVRRPYRCLQLSERSLWHGRCWSLLANKK